EDGIRCFHVTGVQTLLFRSEEVSLIEERPWTRRKEFLALNPAGNIPVLLAEGDHPLVGASTIAEYLDETRGVFQRERRLMAEDPDRKSVGEGKRGHDGARGD